LILQDIQAVEDARQQLAKKKRMSLPDSFIKVVKMRPARSAAQAQPSQAAE
jgi:hypothetical protein